MRTRILLHGIMAALLLVGSGRRGYAAKTQTLSEPTEVQGLPCQGKIELSDTGQIRSCTLARDCTVAAFALPAGTAVRFTETGQVQSLMLGKQAVVEGFDLPAGSVIDSGWALTCTLRRNGLIRGVYLPAGTTIFFKTPKVWESEVPHTWHCWIPQNVVIQRHVCAAIDDACGVVFYPSGKLRAAALAENEEIDGVPCASTRNPFRMGLRVLFYGLDVRVWFHENGHLAQGMVARACTMGGRNFRPGDIVRLTPEGALDPADRTLGGASRLTSKRTPPESHGPD